MTKQKRRTSPVWEDMDPFGSWGRFKGKCKEELKDWLRWCDIVKKNKLGRLHGSPEFFHEDFPMLSGVRLWWELAVSLKISRSQIALQMNTYSTHRDPIGIIKGIVDLLTGTPTPTERAISPLLLADFAVSCSYLCWGAQTDVEKHRQGGNIHQRILNEERRNWAYELRRQNKYVSGIQPPDEFFIKVEEKIENHLVEKTDEIWRQNLAIADDYDRLLFNWDKKNKCKNRELR